MVEDKEPTGGAVCDEGFDDEDSLASIDDDFEIPEFDVEPAFEDILSEKDPIRKLYKLILHQALGEYASDLYVMPLQKSQVGSFGDDFVLSYRVAGNLGTMVPPPRHIAQGLSEAIELHCGSLLEETKEIEEWLGGRKWKEKIIVPGGISLDDQFGMFEQFLSLGEDKGFRRSVISVNKWEGAGGDNYHFKIWYPESIVGLDNYDGGREAKAAIGEMIHEDRGLVVLTGPSNSGKTLTAYSMLNAVKGAEDHTCENHMGAIGRAIVPGGVNILPLKPYSQNYRSQVNSFMGSNPDVVYFDNVSDRFTARTAVEAARDTLVLASVKGDNESGVESFYSFGVDRNLMEKNLLGVIEQGISWPSKSDDGEPVRGDSPKIKVSVHRGKTAGG